MKPVSLIIARGGSKGIPRKNVIDFCGKPLIEWTIRQSIQSNLIVYVSTNDKEISDVSSKAGAIIINRPEELSTDTSSAEDVILHASNYFDADTIVFPQATSPLRKENDIINALSIFENNECDSLFSSSIATDMCIWNSNFNSITYDYKNRKRRQDKETLYLENGSIYIFKKEGFIKNKNRFFGKIGTYVMNTWQSFEIDEPSDLDICEYFMRRSILNGKTSMA